MGEFRSPYAAKCAQACRTQLSFAAAKIFICILQSLYFGSWAFALVLWLRTCISFMELNKQTAGLILKNWVVLTRVTLWRGIHFLHQHLNFSFQFPSSNFYHRSPEGKGKNRWIISTSGRKPSKISSSSNLTSILWIYCPDQNNGNLCQFWQAQLSRDLLE